MKRRTSRSARAIRCIEQGQALIQAEAAVGVSERAMRWRIAEGRKRPGTAYEMFARAVDRALEV